MVDKIQYQRLFWMLKQEDTGYGIGQEPSGYAKIEVKEGRGRLTLVVQNLKENDEKFRYTAYLLKCSDTRVNNVNIGNIILKKNKCEVQYEFTPENVAKSGCSIEEFNMLVVLLEPVSTNKKEIICPLAVYKDKKFDWRSKLKEVLNAKGSNTAIDDNEHSLKQNVLSKYVTDAEPIIIKSVMPEIIGMNDNLEVKSNKADNEIGNKDYNSEQKEADENISNSQPLEEQFNQSDFIIEDFNFPDSKYEQSENNLKDELKSTQNMNAENCKFKNMYPCMAQKNIKGFNPCVQCYANMQKKAENIPENNTALTGGNIEKLKESLNKYFEISNPFNSKRRDYKWWKINNPVYLNNFLYQSNIKTPLLFNPRVLMAHFKYRHLIFGIYTDALRHREYIVCGVPGVYNVDDKPFGDMCRWAQTEGNKPKYGAFGYWLVYMEPKTGRLMSLQ